MAERAEEVKIYNDPEELADNLTESGLKNGFWISATTEKEADAFATTLGELLSKGLSDGYKLKITAEPITEELGKGITFFCTVEFIKISFDEHEH